jgi:hypothetical protein
VPQSPWARSAAQKCRAVTEPKIRALSARRFR